VTPVFTYSTGWVRSCPTPSDLGTAGINDYVRQWVLFGPAGRSVDGPTKYRMRAGGLAGQGAIALIRRTPG